MSKPTVALVYDKLLVQGGGERVFKMLSDAFPEAAIYALNAKPRGFWERHLGKQVISPPLGWLFSSRFLVSALYPFAAILMTCLRVKADIVIVYSSTCGKYVKMECKKSILYSNYPNRGIYEPEKLISSKLLLSLAAPMIALMKPIERAVIRKFDFRYSISDVSRRALQDFSGVDSEVIMPPFDDTAIFPIDDRIRVSRGNYFVLVSRLEPEKEIDYVIDAFRESQSYLRVIGVGSLLSEFRQKSPDNVQFLGYVDDATLALEITCARALIFPSEIEYSLVPIESIFLGTPVISFAAPALQEILNDIDLRPDDANAVFYPEKSASALLVALDRFDQIVWDAAVIKDGAKRFSSTAFKARIRKIVDGLQV